MTMSGLILIPILTGVLLYKLPSKMGRVILFILQGFLGFTAVRFLLQSQMGAYAREILGGDNHILYISLRGDRLVFVLICLTIFLFTICFLYSMKDEFFDNRFVLLFLILQGIIHGIFLTNDLFNLFVLIEVSTVVVTILIMYKRNMRSIYDGLYYFIIQVVSMLFFLFGLAYIYRIFGVLSFEGVKEIMALGIVPQSSLVLPAAFMLAGICLKIGFFPMFSWVSRCYGTPSAPTAVLAIQSGLFVKVNLFHFLRLNDLFYPTLDFTNFFITLAIITGIVGVLKALSQKNIKLLLAYSTVSQVGLITLGTFLSDLSYAGSLYHIIVHGMLKVLLFLCAGIVIDAYGSKNVHDLRGVWKEMPLVAIAILIGIAGITGLPFLNGSVSKYWIMEGSANPIATGAMWVLNTGTILTYIKFGSILVGKAKGKVNREVNGLKIGVLAVLSSGTILSGIFGVQIVKFLFDVDLSVSMMGMLEKGLIYVITIGVGVFLYRLVYNKILTTNDFHYRTFGGSLSLSLSCVMLLLFFMSLMLYSMFI